MRLYRSLIRRARAPCRRGCLLLMLLILVACGASAPPRATNTEFAAPSPATPATSALATTSTGLVASPTSPAATEHPNPAPSTPPTEPPATVPSPATQSAKSPPTPAAASQGWQTYRNDQAGYSVAYPPDWRVAEQPGAPGEFGESFAPKDGGAGIQVAVRPLDPAQREPLDLPNAKCKPVVVTGALGFRCSDSLSSSTTTTLVGKSKQFIIAGSGKRLNPDIYQRFLDSFQAYS